jgi:hypothetical protein
VGTGVVIKPHVRVKFPWKLYIGDHSWIGESVWIDNLAQVTIGSNCCISQGAYLCTGSHRWDRDTFDLVTKPIVIEDQCWVGAMARVAPGGDEAPVLCSPAALALELNVSPRRTPVTWAISAQSARGLDSISRVWGANFVSSWVDEQAWENNFSFPGSCCRRFVIPVIFHIAVS